MTEKKGTANISEKIRLKPEGKQKRYPRVNKSKRTVDEKPAAARAKNTVLPALDSAGRRRRRDLKNQQLVATGVELASRERGFAS